jgi:hypothetical protein
MSGFSPNSATMSIAGSTCMTILVGSGMLGGTTRLSPNGKPNEIGTILARARRAIGPRRLAIQVPRDR